MSTAEFLPANRVALLHEKKSPLAPAYEAAVADCWRKAVERNPRLFNGPIVSPSVATLDSCLCTIRWHHSDFAHYLFSRQNHGAMPSFAVGTLFVSIVVPTTDGRLVAGRMSAHTAAPGVVQLPGGGVSISGEQIALTERDLIASAIQEVSEELGIVLDSGSLRISGVIKRDSPPDIGIVFATYPRVWNEVSAAFTALRERDQFAGVMSEFDELLAISMGADVIDAGTERGKLVDYLPAVVGALIKSGGGAS